MKDGFIKKPRDESLIIEDLTNLTASPGYAHALAYICYRDNFIHYIDKLKPTDLDQVFNKDRLIRTELTTLIGLMVKGPLELFQPSPDMIDEYVRCTDALLKELHDSIAYPIWVSIFNAQNANVTPSSLWRGLAMREPIFYGTESAYTFQYREFVPEKYEADDEWMLKNKGFASGQAGVIAKTMCVLIQEKTTRLLAGAQTSSSYPVTWLPAFEFSLDEVTDHSGVGRDIVEAFFREFLFVGTNSGFKELGDFNEVAARPLLQTDRGTVLLFSEYAIFEALYESPFFWMLDDKAYSPTAAKHRGAFTEKFAERRLAKVFGYEHVHANVNLHRGNDIVGEADVMVIYGDRIIIL
ncbi:MAG: hypothetical protein Q4B13_09965 [Lautropia sp.]|nr:hypothetical protein [Lautropia sp.]